MESLQIVSQTSVYSNNIGSSGDQKLILRFHLFLSRFFHPIFGFHAKIAHWLHFSILLSFQIRDEMYSRK